MQGRFCMMWEPWGGTKEELWLESSWQNSQLQTPRTPICGCTGRGDHSHTWFSHKNPGQEINRNLRLELSKQRVYLCRTTSNPGVGSHAGCGRSPQMKGALLRDVPSLPIAQAGVSGQGQLHRIWERKFLSDWLPIDPNLSPAAKESGEHGSRGRSQWAHETPVKTFSWKRSTPSRIRAQGPNSASVLQEAEVIKKVREIAKQLKFPEDIRSKEGPRKYAQNNNRQTCHRLDVTSGKRH